MFYRIVYSKLCQIKGKRIALEIGSQFLASIACEFASFCARRDSIERNSYGNVAGWLGVRHTPVLYQNG